MKSYLEARYALTENLAAVALSGSYGDLTGRPALGTAASTAAADYATAAQGALADSAVQPTDLAAVATSGAYSDLTGRPVLGTAAATAATDYATAAQGDLADSAVQPNDLATVAVSGAYGDLSGLPSLGTAAATDAGAYATAAQGGRADTAVQPGDLATVATSGAYADLTGLPALGTAAAQNVTAFATAAQGGRADSAVQPGDLAAVATSGSYSDLSGRPTLVTALDGLSDVALTSAAAQDRLRHDGTRFVNTPPILRSTLGSGSGARAINLNNGEYFTATSTGATTWTFANPRGSSAGFILQLTNGGAAAQTWPTSVDWPAGTAPTLTAAGVDVLVFVTDDGGTTWRGALSMGDSK
ncbi:MAG: hypothetical protein LPK02_05195 [Rhodobacterales bacterium]|nr:hypothetical protein [Rhodobacterales bacterium]